MDKKELIDLLFETFVDDGSVWGEDDEIEDWGQTDTGLYEPLTASAGLSPWRRPSE